jgi:hypothetical protein
MIAGTRPDGRATDADIDATRAEYQRTVPALLRLDAKLVPLNADEAAALRCIDMARRQFGQRVLGVAIQFELRMPKERVEKALKSLTNAKLISGIAYTVDESLPDTTCYEMTELGMQHVEVAEMKAEMQRLRPYGSVTDEDAIIFLQAAVGAAKRVANMILEGASNVGPRVENRQEKP